MKAEILKIAGVKSEKDFYKKFPTQEAFMKMHGKAFNKLQKAQNGVTTDSNNNGIPDYLEGLQPINNGYQGVGNIPRQFGSGIQQPNPNFGPQNKPIQDVRMTFPAMYPLPTGWQNPNPLEGLELPVGQLPTIEDRIGQDNQIIENPSTTGGISPIGGKSSDLLKTGLGAIGGIVDGIKALKGERKALKEAKQWKQVSDVALKASQSRDVNAREDIADTARRTRKALMPTITGEELFPVNGVGSNVLTKNGGKMEHGGEIQNTYAPYTLYDDLGYEPLDDANLVKDYYYGGKLSKAQFGMNMFGGTGGIDYAGISNSATSLASNAFGNNAGAQIGGSIADVANMIPGVGPIAGMVAKPVLTAVGGLLDRNPQRIKKEQEAMKRNVQNMSIAAQMQGLHGQYSGIMEDGGNMNPQVIKQFGNMNLADYGKYFFSDMDTLRTGGNIRSNEVGDITAVSGGYLEPISFNPYTGGTGVTSMIKGQSHDESNGEHSGVILNYKGKSVEAERGEPISEREDGGNVDSAVIAGNQTFNKLGATLIPELSEYEGKKVKNIQKDLAMKDAKLNKQQTKNTLALNEFNPRTPIDKLTFNSLSMNELGISKQYKDNADKTENLLAYQEATNNTAHQLGVDAGELTRGKMKPMDRRAAKNGMELAQYGKNFKNKPKADDMLPYSGVGEISDDADWTSEASYEGKWKPRVYGAFADDTRFTKMLNFLENYQGEGSENLKKILAKQTDPQQKRDFLLKEATNKKIGPIHNLVKDVIASTEPAAVKAAPVAQVPAEPNPNYDVTPYNQSGLATMLGQALPWFRPVSDDPLHGEQLAGEMYALSNSQVDPVQARFKHSLLNVPYDISFQDQLNENQADFNSMQKAVGSNPQALAMLAAQKYGANSRVLAEQFRANQAMKDRVYSENRATLNRDLDQNLSIADQQYVRQAQAKSNTKEAIQEALNSVAAKYQQNRLENRTMRVYENMFPDFSYDKNQRIRKTGAPVEFNIDQIYKPLPEEELTHVPLYDNDGNIVGYKQAGTPKVPSLATPKITSRNGSLIQAFKNL